MAAKKKKTTKRKQPTKGGTPLADQVAAGSLSLAAQDGWASVTPARVAQEIGAPLGEVLALYPTRARLASALFRRIDAQVLSQVAGVDHSELARDRLFEILMARFDALQRHRAGYASLVSYVLRRPAIIAMRAPSVVHSMALMLMAAGIDASSPIGMARAHALALAYGSVMRTWLRDDSADMAKTMAALDKSLGRLEKLQSMVFGGGKRSRKSNKESAEPSSE